MADIFEISGRIHSTSQEEVVTTSSEILDEEQNKKQSEVNADVDTALADRYTKEETYNKTELDNLITTPDVQYVTVATYSALPVTGEADTIYRVASWDGSSVDAGKYSEYAWNGSAYQLLAVRSGSLDGVYDAISDISETIGGSLINYIPLNTQNKVIIASTGAISDNAEAIGISDYLSVTPGDTITIVSGVRQPANSSYAFCAFYSANTGAAGTFISSQINVTTATEITGREIEVPIGAHYMILYLNSNDTDAKIIYGKNIISSINELKDRESNVEAAISTIVDLSNGGNYTKDCYILKNTIYSNSSALTVYNADTDSIPLIPVVEGQKIHWHNWKQGSSSVLAVAAIWCYDENGLPYNGNDARLNYGNLTEYDYETGEYSFTIPANCAKIGLSSNLSAYFPDSGVSYIELENGCALTETSKELINEAVNISGGDASKYYLKGSSNIIYSPTKSLGIIAAGQSNIDGRNAYADYPYKDANPNDKVHIKKSSGNFVDFNIPTTGQWAFDSIVYNLLTDGIHGNQSNIYVMKKSYGGTSIDPDGSGGGGNLDLHWTADYEFLPSQNDSLLREFEGVIRSGVDEEGSKFDIKAMLWHQGEADSHNEQVAKRYYDNLKNMFAYIRGVVDNPRLHIFCGNITLERSNPDFIYIINEAYERLASEDPYLHVVDMSHAQVQSDGIHFNYEWSIYFGQMVYDMMIDAGIITGTKVNPTPPTNS